MMITLVMVLAMWLRVTCAITTPGMCLLTCMMSTGYR